MKGTIRKDQDGWSVVYFVTAEDCDAVARVEMKLHKEDHEHVNHGDLVDFEAVKVGKKLVAKLERVTTHKREINDHLKQVVL